MSNATASKDLWYWPIPDDFPSIQSPVGFVEGWKEWPGSMREGPSPKSEIFAREFVQNSWDAIQERISHLKSAGKPTPRGTGVTFHFVELTGDKARNFRRRFGIDELGERYRNLDASDKRDVRLNSSCLESNPKENVRLLLAIESSGGGMSGMWRTQGFRDNPPSKMNAALIGSFSSKEIGASGGSYGHGKRGVALASQMRTIAAYSCFEPIPAEPNVSRRFIGVSFWAQHKSETLTHTGIGLIGDPGEAPLSWQNFRPLDNEAADSFIRELEVPFLEQRSPSEDDQIGTSFLFVDPSFEPAELAESIARSWWPLLEKNEISIKVFNEVGNIVPINYHTEEIEPFVKAFRIARGQSGVIPETDLKEQVTVQKVRVGELAITFNPDPSGWSYVSKNLDDTSIIALIRNDMVIAYQASPLRNVHKPPWLRGAFVVDSEQNREASQMLKMAEPPLHNLWKTTRESEYDDRSIQLAEAVLKRINNARKELWNRVRPDASINSVPLSEFSKLFSAREKSRGGHKAASKRNRRPFKIVNASKASPDRNILDKTQLRLQGEVVISLDDWVELDELEVLVDLGWKVFEESGAVRDESLFENDTIEAPNGFVREGSLLRGILTKSPATFLWQSAFFPDYWQLSPDPVVTPAKEVTKP